MRGQVEIERPKATIANVAGVLPGAGELADQVIVIGAHYDHLGYGQIGSMAGVDEIHPGADDNASGTAGLVLLAQRFAQRVPGLRSDPKGDSTTPPPSDPASSSDPAPSASVSASSSGSTSTTSSASTSASLPLPPASRRTLLFVAFSGEERGLLGSAHMVKHLDDVGLEPSDIVAMLNMDMIGRMKQQTLFVLGTGTGDRWEALIEAANERVGLDVQTQTKPFGGSDHVSFQHQGVPSLHFFTGVHEDYHRPSDTAEKVNHRGAVRVLNLIEALIEQLWVAPDPVQFVSDSLSDDKSGGAFHGEGGGAYLGVMPDYMSMHGRDGCVVSSVLPGSPAQAGGLRGDDVIVRWDDQPVANVYDLSRMLHRSKPGDEITLEVYRRQDDASGEVDSDKPTADESPDRGDDPATRLSEDDGPLIRLTITLGERRRPVQTLE